MRPEYAARTARASMRLFALLLLCLFACPSHAQLAPPEIRSVFPLGGRPGATTRVTITGVSLRDASAIRFDTTGVTAKILPTISGNLPAPTMDSDGDPPVVAEFTVAKEVPAEIVHFRVVSSGGISSVGKWLVGRDIPDIAEKEPNNAVSEAQSVSLPVAVNGAIDTLGDQDVFAFDLEAGKTFVAEVKAAVVDSSLDSLLTLRDANGEVASNDDYNGPDSLLI